MDTNSSEELRILCFGDIVARPGRTVLREKLPALIDRYAADLVIANGENAAGGTGIDPVCAREIFEAGVDVITLGDHTWRRRDVVQCLSDDSPCIRPANYPQGVPGKGWVIVEKKGRRVGVMNLLGRTFLNMPLECPFRTAEQLLAGPFKDTHILICDIHAEATSEKMALARFLDGKLSLLFGTHSHVATADAQILPGRTAYVTDLGMSGSMNGVIGLDHEVALERFLTGRPIAYKPAKGAAALQGICAVIDSNSGKAISIERVD